MEEPIYVVTEGAYENNSNVLLTVSLDKAVKRYLEGYDKVSSIQIWINEECIHEYGTYTFENYKTNYDTVYRTIKFIEEKGLDQYLGRYR